ncbi:MAG: hypothetical protein IPI65_16840 [Bacteroidetes bacterium]|nr:hypothetical protein [Bacteroidota bacterium]
MYLQAVESKYFGKLWIKKPMNVWHTTTSNFEINENSISFTFTFDEHEGIVLYSVKATSKNGFIFIGEVLRGKEHWGGINIRLYKNIDEFFGIAIWEEEDISYQLLISNKKI